MRELSLNILDIAQNSVAANASLIEIEIDENTACDKMTVTIGDNGKGMTAEQLERVRDPFYTTRTTRKVGMGIPLFKLAAEMTGGSLDIKSKPGAGTKVTAVFGLSNIDRAPLGDMASTAVTLIGMNPNLDFVYHHIIDGKEFTVDTRELKKVLGDVPLSEPEVMEWIKGFINEQTQIIRGGVNKNENS